MSDPSPAVIVVKGPDRELRTRTLDELVPRLLGDDDRTLALEEAHLPPRTARGEESGNEARVAALGATLAGARTPPFGTARRIVVLRSDEGLTIKDDAQLVTLLVDYLADPEPTTVLVIESVGAMPAPLAKALKGLKAETVGAVAHKDAVAGVLSEQLRAARIKLDKDALREVVARLGEDAGRVPGFVDLVAATFGPGATLGVDDVAPYLGEAGGVPVFELTKAIDGGDVPGALGVLHRMTDSMKMHPLQIMAILHNHFRRILRLDDPAVRSEEDAVGALGGKVHPYPTKLAWQRAKRLGTEGIGQAFALLAKADRDLRGGSGAPDDAIVAVLVTELTMLAKRGARAPARG